jgi:hypothetical protein
MQLKDIQRTDAIHVASFSEYERIIKLFAMDDEYLNWNIYEKDTVLYPMNNQYGYINGYCKDHNFIVISSYNIHNDILNPSKN